LKARDSRKVYLPLKAGSLFSRKAFVSSDASSKPFGVNVEELEAIGLTCDLSEKGT